MDYRRVEGSLAPWKMLHSIYQLILIKPEDASPSNATFESALLWGLVALAALPAAAGHIDHWGWSLLKASDCRRAESYQGAKPSDCKRKLFNENERRRMLMLMKDCPMESCSLMLTLGMKAG